jgi:acyl carrier protein
MASPTLAFSDLKELLIKRVGVRPDHVVEDLGVSFTDMGVDSLGVTELLLAIEQIYGIQIPEEDVAQLTTLGSVIEYTNARLK